MTNLAHNSNQSPFDSIRKFDEQGHEYWSARDLMPLLGYKQWRRLADAIDRAKASCAASGDQTQQHFYHLPASANGKGKGKTGENYKLSRFACYLVSMNGDPRKTEVASAQSYFAVKTRQAELQQPQPTYLIASDQDRLDAFDEFTTMYKLASASLPSVEGMNAGKGRAYITNEIYRAVTGLTAKELKESLKNFLGRDLKYSDGIKNYIKADYLRQLTAAYDGIYKLCKADMATDEQISNAVHIGVSSLWESREPGWTSHKRHYDRILPGQLALNLWEPTRTPLLQ